MGVGVILGVDGGNSKTELLAASVDGELLALVRGGGSNSHAVGAEGTAEVIAGLLADARVETPVDAAVFFLCGADVPGDVAELEAAVAARRWARRARVDNDTFALLRAGSESEVAVAVICGSGINCVGRAGARVVRYPSLGWETGDWGGSEMLGREAVFLAARAEDGRGAPTELVEIVRSHFAAATVAELGADVHYRRRSQSSLGELAPLVVEAAARDATAGALVARLAREVALMVERAFRDLGVDEGDVVLGGGMLASGAGPLHDAVLAALPDGAQPVVLRDPPVLGAALAALDDVGADEAAKRRLREAVRAG
ncbi:MAG TPA: BadF/BadG/BcrA/BcrD ATPase family protein [Gaiellaceae bacterium]|nr:BadF/BadG/BcrA/BcrD ATPase family protein [Gaiellaceae bacterium]